MYHNCITLNSTVITYNTAVVAERNIAMINLDYRSGIAIYEQVVKSIERLIHCGGLEKDQKLPSVRELSTELSVNPNTIQKAYSVLEQKGMIYSVKGRGNFVSNDTNSGLELRYTELLNSIQNNISELLLMGYNKALLNEKLNDFSENGGVTND